MPIIPQPKDSTLKRINTYWENRAKEKWQRRLGASQIGRECERELWYSFHWAKKIKWAGRMLRLFEHGHREEEIICEEFRGIGVEIMPVDPETIEQWEFSELGDHMVCKLDGAARGFIEAPMTWHVCEFKTANQKAFDTVQKDGCQKAKPEHYAQMQVGMGMSEMDRAAYIVVNKNTDELYFERIEFDPKAYKALIEKAKSVIFAEDPPEKLNDSPAFYKCKFCSYSAICHDNGECAELNCRTCKHSEPLEDGGWACKQQKAVISHETMQERYDCHEYREGMTGSFIQEVAKKFEGKIIAVEGNVSKMDEENLSI